MAKAAGNSDSPRPKPTAPALDSTESIRCSQEYPEGPEVLLHTSLRGELRRPPSRPPLAAQSCPIAVLDHRLFRGGNRPDRLLTSSGCRRRELGRGSDPDDSEWSDDGQGGRVQTWFRREDAGGRYAARRRETTGRWRRPAKNDTSSRTCAGVSGSTGTWGEAHREPAGHRDRSSSRGSSQAGGVPR